MVQASYPPIKRTSKNLEISYQSETHYYYAWWTNGL